MKKQKNCNCFKTALLYYPQFDRYLTVLYDCDQFI